jgi:hypothetical protein
MNKYNGMNVRKLIPADQAQLINKYKNMERKLFKCNSSIYFNKQCMNRNVIPQ